MTASLYDLGVLTFLQTLRAVAGVLDRAAKHCADIGADPDDFVRARLHPDMAPFHFQIEAMKNHAVGGMEALETGVFDPPPLIGAMPFGELRTVVAEAVATLETFTPEEVDSWSGKKLNLAIFRPVDEESASTSAWAPRDLNFTSEIFLLTYSIPNFYFHAVTAYNILRTRGVPIGKGDYEGRLRTGTGRA